MTDWFEHPLCYFCGAQGSGIHDNTIIDGQRSIIHICPEHGGPAYRKPVPENHNEISATIKSDLPEYLRDLVDNYAGAGFNYGQTPEGFYEWARAQRYICNIAPSAPRATARTSDRRKRGLLRIIVGAHLRRTPANPIVKGTL